MTLKFVIILQNLVKAYHRKSGKSKYDRKLTELDVETKRIRSRAFHGGTMEYTSCMTSQRQSLFPISVVFYVMLS